MKTQETQTETTTAAKLLFQIQFMGLMLQTGRTEEANTAYQKAQLLAQELIDAGQ